MTTSPIRLERRARQRFDFNLPVSLRLGNARSGSGFTQNLSARGLLLCSDPLLVEGETLELTLAMPSEVTLAEAMRVRCQGRVLRVLSAGSGAKCVAAIHMEKYDYLPAESDLPAFSKIAALPDHAGEDETVTLR